MDGRLNVDGATTLRDTLDVGVKAMVQELSVTMDAVVGQDLRVKRDGDVDKNLKEETYSAVEKEKKTYNGKSGWFGSKVSLFLHLKKI